MLGVSSLADGLKIELDQASCWSSMTSPRSAVAVASGLSFAMPTGSSRSIAISETLFSSANPPASASVPAPRAGRVRSDSLPSLKSGSLVLVRHTPRTANGARFRSTQIHIRYREVDHVAKE